MEEQIIKCTYCEYDYMHITNVYNTKAIKMDNPPCSCGYRQGAVVVELTCEGCGHKQYIVVGEHKGQVFLSEREEMEVQ